MLSLKGGVGKTTITATLGATFASIRGDRVVAVDANPDRGTLSQKIPLETPATVRQLLHDAGTIERYSDVRRYTSQGPSGLEVLASESDPAISDAFSADDYARTLDILERFYGLVLTDCGTGLLHSAMSSVLEKADALIVVSSGSIDGARSASATLDWLDAHGHEELVRNSIAVINAVRPRSGKVDMQKVVDHFSRRCRAVRLVPFDPHLEEGAEIDLDRLRRETREALTELAAVVADGFPGDHGPTRLRLTRVVVAVAQPPQEVWIVVGSDDASLRPVGLRPRRAPADVDQRPQNQDEEQVEHSTPPWGEYTRAVGSDCVKRASDNSRAGDHGAAGGIGASAESVTLLLLCDGPAAAGGRGRRRGDLWGRAIAGHHQFPIVVAVLFALIIAMPLGIWLFGPLRRRATAALAIAGERRRREREQLRARLRGEALPDDRPDEKPDEKSVEKPDEKPREESSED